VVSRRIVRQFLVASLIAFHATIALCGPCLHELPGLGHENSAGLTSQTQQHPLKALQHDSADACPLCHFLSQGQMPITASPTVQSPLAGEWMASLPDPGEIEFVGRPFRQRAPPVTSF
jgi:hypothetical protein